MVDGQVVTPNNQLTLWTDGTLQVRKDHNTWLEHDGRWLGERTHR